MEDVHLCQVENHCLTAVNVTTSNDYTKRDLEHVTITVNHSTPLRKSKIHKNRPPHSVFIQGNLQHRHLYCFNVLWYSIPIRAHTPQAISSLEAFPLTCNISH